MAERTLKQIFLVTARRDEQAFSTLADDSSQHG
jgi:hypothetical protein